MKLDFRKAAILSFKYSISIRKLPYYFLFQIFALLLIFSPLLNLVEISYDSGLFQNKIPDPRIVDFIVESFGYFFLAIVLVLILSSVVTPTLIYNYVQYRNKKDDTLIRSFKQAKPHILTVFGAFITLAFLINIISGIISMITSTLGTIVAILMTLAFIFVIPDIIIRKSSISKSLASSYSCTRKNTFEAIGVYFIISFFSLVVTLFFGIPLVMVLSQSLAPLFEMLNAGGSYAILIPAFISLVKAKADLYIVSIITLLLGNSISRLFSIAFITEIYLQMLKK